MMTIKHRTPALSPGFRDISRCHRVRSCRLPRCTRPTRGEFGSSLVGASVRSAEDIRDAPFEPDWCSIAPSRFGTVRSVLETIEYRTEQDIRMYGGGQCELCVGRGHIQLLASLFYPDGPNEVAPRAYNKPASKANLRSSPLSHLRTRPGWNGSNSNLSNGQRIEDFSRVPVERTTTHDISHGVLVSSDSANRSVRKSSVLPSR